jgi:hypothetical protein
MEKPALVIPSPVPAIHDIYISAEKLQRLVGKIERTFPILFSLPVIQETLNYCANQGADISTKVVSLITVRSK